MSLRTPWPWEPQEEEQEIDPEVYRRAFAPVALPKVDRPTGESSIASEGEKAGYRDAMTSMVGELVEAGNSYEYASKVARSAACRTDRRS